MYPRPVFTIMEQKLTDKQKIPYHFLYSLTGIDVILCHKDVIRLQFSALNGKKSKESNRKERSRMIVKI